MHIEKMKSNTVSTLVLFSNIVGINSWKYDYLVNKPCKFLAVDAKKGLSETSFSFITAEVESYLYLPISRINCTVDYAIRDWNLGSEVNGQYSHLIGRLQRGEAASAIVPVREGSLVGEPVKFGPVLVGSDLAILSMNRKSHEINVGVEDCLRNFAKPVYDYSYIVFTSFVIIYSFLGLRLRSQILKWKWFRSFKKTFWKCFCMLINQEYLNPRTVSAAVLYFSFCAYIFCIVNVFFCLMSADLVKKIEPPAINTVKDLLYHNDFKHLKVVAAKGSWQEQGFLSTVAGSDESKLWERKGERFKLSVTEFQYLSSTIHLVLHSLSRGEAVFVFDTLPLNIFMSIGCQANLSRFGPYLHVSDEKFIPGNLMLSYNPKIDAQLKSYFDESYQRIQESGWVRRFFSQLGYKLNLGNIGEYEIYKCVSMIRSTEKAVPKPFDVIYLSKAFIATIILNVIAFGVLIMEHVLHKSVRWLRLGMKKDKKRNVKQKHHPINKFSDDYLIRQNAFVANNNRRP